jgi:hypothetical protein
LTVYIFGCQIDQRLRYHFGNQAFENINTVLM